MSAEFRKIFSVILMSGCLLFLTAVNFFLYPADRSTNNWLFVKSNGYNQSAQLPVPIPTEEKSCESGLSLIEELLHEHNLLIDSKELHKVSQRIIVEGDKLLIVHSELFSPPPESSDRFI